MMRVDLRVGLKSEVSEKNEGCEVDVLDGMGHQVTKLSTHFFFPHSYLWNIFQFFWIFLDENSERARG